MDKMRETLEAARKFISDELDNATLSGASPTALSASPSHDSPPLYLPRGDVNQCASTALADSCGQNPKIFLTFLLFLGGGCGTRPLAILRRLSKTGHRIGNPA
jgi:hypothetical protein